MSSAASSLWTNCANAFWFSSVGPSLSRSRPIRSSIHGRHSSTTRSPLFGGLAPVRRSRTISASASSSGASVRCVDLGHAGTDQPVVEHRREIAGDTFHAPRADRLDPGLLDGIETGPRGLGLRHQAAMDVAVVAGEAQRHRVRMAAHDGRVAGIELARRLRQPRLGALGRADEVRPLRREGDFEIGRPRERPHAAGDCALERLLRRFGLAWRLVVGGQISLDRARTARP